MIKVIFILLEIKEYIYIKIKPTIEWLLVIGKNYDDLIISLIGGELTLITLFFSLIPTLIEKREKEFYLNKKITDHFLYYKNKFGELEVTWIIGIIITLINIITCMLKYDRLSFLVFVGFIFFFFVKIRQYLIFISNKEKIKKEITQLFKRELENDNKKTLEQLIDITKNNPNYNYIYETMDYLYNTYDKKDYFNKYIDELLDLPNINKENIYIRITSYIKQDNGETNVYLDERQIYKFFRNTLTDYNKEQYYEIMIDLIINDYKNQIKEDNLFNNLIPGLFNSIDDSSLSIESKKNLKNTILNFIHNITENKMNISEEKYFRNYKYIFKIIKHIIDNFEYELFKKIIRTNDIDDKESTMNLDLYLTIYLYLYYLIFAESEKYVCEKDKRRYKAMLLELKEKYDLIDFKVSEHYYKNLETFIENLKNINLSWERFDWTDDYDVKSCVIDSVTNTFEKLLVLTFQCDYSETAYTITNYVTTLFLFDFENGKLKANIKNYIDNMNNILFDEKINSIKYDLFEKSYMDYVEVNYKNEEISKSINLKDLRKKIDEEIPFIKQEISNLEIINSKQAQNIEEFHHKIILNKYFIDNHFKDKGIIHSSKLSTHLENFIYEKIIDSTDNIIFYQYTNEQVIVDNINKTTKHDIYFKPNNEILGEKWKFGNAYTKKISKFKIINTGVQNIRLLVKDFNCELLDITADIQEPPNNYIQKRKKELHVSRNRYCLKNELGYNIYYTNKEIEEYIKNTTVILDIKVTLKIDVKGDNNLAIIRDSKNNKKYKKKIKNK